MKIFIHVAVVIDVGLFIRLTYYVIKICYDNCKVIKRRMKWEMVVHGRQVKIWMEVAIACCPKSRDICLVMTRHLEVWRQFERDSSPIPTEWNAAISPVVAVCPTSLHANTVSGWCCVRIHSRRSCVLKRLWIQFWLHTLRTTGQIFYKRGRKLANGVLWKM